MVDAKAGYESTLIHQSATQSKSCIYKYIRSLCRTNTLPFSMHLNDEVATLDDHKARLFNEYFHSVYSSPSTIRTPEQLSKSHVDSACISSIVISEEDIFNALSSLDPSKAKGIDNIGPLLLKQCSLALTAPYDTSLTPQFQLVRSHHNGKPIFKFGDRSSVSNYRPISLLPIISKVFERLIYDKIIAHVTPQLSSSQLILDFCAVNPAYINYYSLWTKFFVTMLTSYSQMSFILTS